MNWLLRRVLWVFVTLNLLFLVSATALLAHQPFFEEVDLTLDTPMAIADPSISVALYATLESEEDVDFFTFLGLEAQSVLVGMSIPEIEGQADFAPTIAVMGNDLPQTAPDELPAVLIPLLENGMGFVVIPPPAQGTHFFEPFSFTSYWKRQEQRVKLPSSGTYLIAVWHETGELGRYTLVVGEKEVWGGDPQFRSKMKDYWTPVKAPGEASSALPPCTLMQAIRIRILGQQIACQP